MMGRQAAEEEIELGAGLRRYRITVRECPLDSPARALLVRRGRRRWVGVTRDLHPAARRAAPLEIVQVLETDLHLLFYLVEEPPRA
jgi:hypothetical protein